MLVSVIMPMYNGEKYIKPCIESILNQSFKNFELIIIDDGSQDKSAEIIKEYMKNDTRIKYVYQENQSACVALNNGVKIAQGKYITFVDNDDLVEVDTYEKVVSNLSKNDADVVIYGYSQDFIDENYSTICKINTIYATDYEEEQKSIIEIFQNGLFHPFWNKWYKKDIVINSGIVFDERYNSMGDYAFNCKLFPFFKKILTLDFVGYHYLKRNRDSLVASYVKNMVPCFIERRKLTIDLFDFFKLWDIEQAREYYAKQYYFESEDFLINLYKKNCDLPRKQKTEYISQYILDEKSFNIYETMKTDTLYSKIFKLSIKSRNAQFIGFVYENLTFLKNNLFGIYKIFRKMQYKRFK